MNVFAKIFSQIFDSSISSDYVVRHVFMDLLVLADRDGVVDMTTDAIARRTNVPEEMVIHSIQRLMEPDSKSRSTVADGSRIVHLDSHRNWGWQIVNFEHYRNIRDDESRRSYFRDKKREYRSRGKSINVQEDSLSPHVSTRVLDSPHVSTQAEGEAEGEAEDKNKKNLFQCFLPKGMPPAVIRLPAVGGKEYAVSQDQVSHWEELYPAVDVMQALREMVGWLEAEPKRKKTANGMVRFITGWLARAQNRGPRNGWTGFNGKGQSNLNALAEALRSDQDGTFGDGIFKVGGN